MLDLDSVRLFVLATEFGSLTRAAEAAGTVQPVVSQRLKALEAMLGHKLLERTPRFVRPTAAGSAFLERARALLAAHDAALRLGDAPPLRFALAASDHALGLALEPLFRRLRAALPPGAGITLRTGLSQEMRARFEAGECDAAVIRREAGGSEGEVLGHDPLGWRGGEGVGLAPGEPVPLATLGPACGVRGAATRALDRAGLPWRESFIGGSCAALLAGAEAGLGIAPMGRIAAGAAPDRGPALALPPLPASEIVLFARTGTPALAAAVRALAAGIRASLG
ncbi:LysR family transcriptional regulator [Belnapia rosea]|uniref:Transcriptional regulator, LysR family n=1 Tax=Belnapia rosea TaxID=938405 RepID=A0A1G6M6D3_9PROT|nr:LysR family transcriptional regulator [Belnapia rosea]SDB44188.1 transcriptional regulator, LysR family [Belnapia rosea]SDC51122.1 transcriptional regulator, LysR family [Belnapia rosea]